MIALRKSAVGGRTRTRSTYLKEGHPVRGTPAPGSNKPSDLIKINQYSEKRTPDSPPPITWAADSFKSVQTMPSWARILITLKVWDEFRFDDYQEKLIYRQIYQIIPGISKACMSRNVITDTRLVLVGRAGGFMNDLKTLTHHVNNLLVQWIFS